MKNKLKYWIVPAILSLLLFLIARPTLAQISDRETRLSQHLAENDIEVGNEAVEGRSRAFYVFEDEKIYFGDQNWNLKQVNSVGEYITYVADINGEGQVFLYHIPTGKNIQITHSGTNLSPKVSSTGDVVWEGWIDEGWQLFVYDGKRAFQLTQGEISKNADIEGDYIVFARKSPAGFWYSVAYSLKEDRFEDISASEASEYPNLEADGTIYYGPPTQSQKRYPLKVSDLFLLNLGSLSVTGDTEDLTLNDILAQLTEAEGIATGSAETDIATESASTN